MDTLEFLSLVWGREECYVDLPSKAGGHWIPYPLEWPADKGLIRRRITSCLEDEEDVYFSVARFKSRGRRIADTLPAHWLWADLDRVDPVFLDEDEVQPTLSWQSSNGRYQALWRLTRTLPPEKLEVLNRRLSYAIGADRGGWDLTQVLRPVGTKNYKYDPPANVELLWYNPDLVYSPKDLITRIRSVESDPESHAAPQAQRKFERGIERVVDLRRLPARARRLLATPEDQVVQGERSTRLWELECLLIEAGLTDQQVFDLVWPSAWNKHKEVHSGEHQLEREIAKAAERVRARDIRSPRTRLSDKEERADEAGDDGPGTERESRSATPFVSYANFLSATIEAPRWLIEDIWSSTSHGIIGGEPKTSKSTFAICMGLAVATGTPLFRKWETVTQGPVLMIQEENAPWVIQDRLRKAARYAGLIRGSDVEISEALPGSLVEHVVRLDFPDEAPFWMLNNYGFDLTDDEDRELLEDFVQEEGVKMLILDPLYLIAGGININSQQEITVVMKYLLDLRYKMDCAVVVVHHWHKASADTGMRRPGQRLMGSGLLHGWIESAMYMERMPDEGDRLWVRCEREFRNVSPRAGLEVGLTLGEPGDIDGMDVLVREYTAEGRVLDLVQGAVGSGGILLTALAEALGVDKGTARARAISAGCVVNGTKKGRGVSYLVYPPGYKGEEVHNGKQ